MVLSVPPMPDALIASVSQKKQEPGDGLAPGARFDSEAPGDEPDPEPEDQPEDDALDVHAGKILRLGKRTHHDRGGPARTVDLKSVAARTLDVDRRGQVPPPLVRCAGAHARVQLEAQLGDLP